MSHHGSCLPLAGHALCGNACFFSKLHEAGQLSCHVHDLITFTVYALQVGAALQQQQGPPTRQTALAPAPVLWRTEPSSPAQGQHLDAPAQDHPLHTAEADAALAAPSATVFIKNLAFSTRDEAVRQHFDQAVSAAGGVIRSAVVHTSAAGSRSKLGKGKDAKVKVLSSGFGFVECSSEEVAKSVIKRMQVGAWKRSIWPMGFAFVAYGYAHAWAMTAWLGRDQRT